MNATYMRARSLSGRPVVTLGGEDVAQIKDTIFRTEDASIDGFTLSGRGLLSGPLKATLSWENVHHLGPDAVMIRDEDALTDQGATAGQGDTGGNVLGGRAVSEDGVDLGEIVDVVLEVSDIRQAHVAGLDIAPSGTMWPSSKHMLLPLPGPTAASGDVVIIPDSALRYATPEPRDFPDALQTLRTTAEGGT
ncbi:PRC-barrel domain-containing protein [Streptomyces sp. NPDC058864]